MSVQQKNKTEISENLVVTSTVGHEPLTEQEMADLFKIDTAIWETGKILTNSWPMGAKDERKDLSFVDGVVSGEVKTGGIIVTRLYQTKIWWVRKEPIIIHPILRPVVLDLGKLKAPKISKPLPKKNNILVVPDIHAGYRRENGKDIPMHDLKAMDIILQIANEHTFSHIILLGDMLDFAEWSNHWPTSNDLTDTTQKALVDFGQWVAKLRLAQPKAKFVYLEGNHEVRMRKLLISLVPAAYGLHSVDNLEGFPVLSVPNLLGFNNLDIEWVEGYPGVEYWIDGILFTHGEKAKKSGMTAATLVNENSHSTVFGHVHRREEATRTFWVEGKKKEIFALSPGCLCRVDDTGVVPASKDRNNWQQGALILQKTSTGYNPQKIRIKDGKGYYLGKEYS